MVLTRSLIRFGAHGAEGRASNYDAPASSRITSRYDAPSTRSRIERPAGRPTGGVRAPAARHDTSYTTPTAPMQRERGA